MAYDIRKVKTMTDLIGYFSQNLQWNIDVDDFDDIEDISYDFDAEDIGLKEESFARFPLCVNFSLWSMVSDGVSSALSSTATNLRSLLLERFSLVWFPKEETRRIMLFGIRKI